MTFVDFQKKVKTHTIFEKYYYYILCIIVLALSLYLFYSLVTQPQKFNGPIFLFFLLSFILFGFSISGFYFIPNRYKIITIKSNLPISRKEEIISKLVYDLAEIKTTNPSQYLSFSLKTKWWQSRYVVKLFFDEEAIHYSLLGHDYDGGFLDFGETERKRKMIFSRIMESL